MKYKRIDGRVYYWEDEEYTVVSYCDVLEEIPEETKEEYECPTLIVKKYAIDYIPKKNKKRLPFISENQ
jgi:hypothetical protein